MAARPLHLFEAGVVTEQRFIGLQEAPATLGPRFAERLGADKRVRIPFNPRDRWLTAAREACRILADGVLATLREGATPLVLGGECTVVAGALSGALIADPELSLVYLDAHGDFNTLATTPSHYISGMVLAHLCGRSVAPLLFPGSRKIADDRVALVGARALDGGEIENLDRSRVLRIAFDREHPEAPGLVAWTRRRPLWLHVDVDVVDPREFPAVAFAAIGGPALASLADLLRQLFAVADVKGMSLCGFDARADRERRLAAPLVDAIAGAIPRVAVRA
ncbi:MAG TPA: arginase family protein [Candidatus Limnocylindria bacterium]|jgi:arginase family enzyme|nr:arginase family protein [Candidatus Limnocylindria bacterium]